jgi:hypothetical protein
MNRLHRTAGLRGITLIVLRFKVTTVMIIGVMKWKTFEKPLIFLQKQSEFVFLHNLMSGMRRIDVEQKRSEVSVLRDLPNQSKSIYNLLFRKRTVLLISEQFVRFELRWLHVSKVTFEKSFTLGKSSTKF